MGLNSIPTRVIAGLTKTQKQEYVIADNKLAQLSGRDGALLRSELAILIRDDFDIETTGFSTAEIAIMLNGAEMPEGDNPDDLQNEDISEEVVSRAGDLWQLGHHRLFCGDALLSESYTVLMEGGKAQIVITDPPYNVPIAGNVCGKGKVKHQEFGARRMISARRVWWVSGLATLRLLSCHSRLRTVSQPAAPLSASDLP